MCKRIMCWKMFGTIGKSLQATSSTFRCNKATCEVISLNVGAAEKERNKRKHLIEVYNALISLKCLAILI